MLYLVLLGTLLGGPAWSQAPEAVEAEEEADQGVFPPGEEGEDTESEEEEAAAPGQEVEVEKTTVVKETTHDVVPANTLWDLAEHYYKDPWKWPVIYEANKDRVKDPHWIYPNQNLIIPGFSREVTVVRKTAKSVMPPPPEPARPEPTPEPPPPAVEKRVAAPAPRLNEELPEAFPLSERLSEEMPDGMVTEDASSLVVVDKSWKEDGVVRAKMEEGLGITGDLIEYQPKGDAPAPGTRLTVFREGDPKDDSKRALQVVAVIRVVSAKDSMVRAEIMSTSDAVLEGDYVKKQ